MTSTSFHFMTLLAVVVASGVVDGQDVAELYSFNNFKTGPVGPPINPKSFFDTCIKFRDANNLFNDEEQLHHPILPPPTSFGRDSRFDNNYNSNQDYLEENNNNDNDFGDINKHKTKTYVPKFLTEFKHCTDYKCMAKDLERDPRQLGRFQCYSSTDCETQISGMYCRKFPGSNANFCDCPRGQAYNATSCRCQPAELCWNKYDNCHNGMKCSDKPCFCSDMSKQLFDPHGGFCVEPASNPRSWTTDEKWAAEYYAPQQSQAEVIVVSILAAVVGIVLISLGVYLCHQHANGLLFQRGEYECEADETDVNARPKPKPKKVVAVGKFAVPIPPVGGARRPKRQLSGAQQAHVAAWDLPSLDYLDEEQAIKYLHRPSPDTKKSGTAGGDSSYDGGATTSTVEAGDVGAGLAASSSSISSSRQSLQSGDVVVESRPSGRPGRHSRTGSVDLRFNNPAFATTTEVELLPDGGGKPFDSITMSSDIL